MQNVLIIGGTGFTGSHLTAKLLSLGYNVRLLLRSTPKKHPRTWGPQTEIVLGDICDRASVGKAVQGIDTVFNLAAAYRTAGITDAVYHDVHVKGVNNLLRASFEHGIERFVHCSTAGVHGHIASPPANEDSPFKPGDIYQRTKLSGELLVSESFDTTGIPFTIIRPCAIYGPGDYRLLKLFRLASMRFTPILGNGKVFYHMIHVTDLVDSFILAASHPNAKNETFIIGEDRCYVLNDIIDTIRKIMRRKGTRVHLPAPPFQLAGTVVEKMCIPLGIEPPIYRRRVDFFTKSRSFSNLKAKNRLGFEPKIDLQSGLRATYEWYKGKGLLH